MKWVRVLWLLMLLGCIQTMDQIARPQKGSQSIPACIEPKFYGFSSERFLQELPKLGRCWKMQDNPGINLSDSTFRKGAVTTGQLYDYVDDSLVKDHAYVLLAYNDENVGGTAQVYLFEFFDKADAKNSFDRLKERSLEMTKNYNLTILSAPENCFSYRSKSNIIGFCQRGNYLKSLQMLNVQMRKNGVTERTVYEQALEGLSSEEKDVQLVFFDFLFKKLFD